jgi:hypothetical protein
MPALIPVVPAKDRRHLHYGMKGNDVKAYGRLLHRTLLHLGLKTINAQSGVYGPQMHAYERLLLQLPAPPPAKNGVRIAAQMRAMLVLRMLVYSQARPAATNLAGFHQHDDCSGSALLARALAVGTPFDGYGNTGTIWDNFAHVDPASVEAGDFILYGPGNKTTHTAVVSDVKNRLAIGFGSAPGRESDWRYRHDLMGYRRGA